jgi:hypothetical protein
MIISSLLSGPISATSLVDQVQTLIFLLIVTLVVALFSRLLRLLLPRWKDKLVRAEVEQSLPTQA